MKVLIEKIKNLLPYLFLISIYFFFVNIEVQKNTSQNIKNTNGIKNDEEISQENSNIEDDNLRLKIPVIPFNE